jgi:mono/diheme cytochrome c family protein
MAKSISFFIIILSVFSCNSHKKTDSIAVENAKKGETLFNTTGCVTCHSISGESKYGPPLNSILDQDMQVIRNGNMYTMKADRKYILRSLQDPGFEKVDNYQKKTMPKVNLSPEEIEYLVDYLMFININHTTGPIGK